MMKYLFFILLLVTSQIFAFSDDGAIGFGVSTFYHPAPVEKRGSQEAKFVFLNSEGNLSVDLRIITIARSGLFSADPAYGMGASFRYYPLFPDVSSGIEESGFVIGIGIGTYHYFVGKASYPLDPFLETIFGYHFTISDTFSILVEATGGLFPYLYNSDYFKEESLVSKLRPRVGGSLSLLFGW